MFHILIISVWLDAAQALASLNLTIKGPHPVAENAPKYTVVTNITVSIPDDHSLVGDPEIVNADPIIHPFIITPKDANQWQLMTTASPDLDYETVALYKLPILVRDDKGSTASQTIFVLVTDVNEPPEFTGVMAQLGRAVEIYISEDTPENTQIFSVTVKDPEGSSHLEFSIKVSPNCTTFDIDDTGTIFTTEAFHLQHSEKSYSVMVTVTDPKGLSVIGHLKIFLVQVKYRDPILTCTLFSTEKDRLAPKTENSTSVVMMNITLDEEIPIGKNVGICHIVEKESSNDISFSLDPSSPYFMIDRTHGTLRIASRLDVEEDGFISFQSFTIKACNKVQRCAAILVMANIRGINDNLPYCDPYVYRYISKETIANNTVVASLRCHDKDKPPDPLHYEAHGGPVGAGMLFEQVPGSGNIIQTTRDLDCEDPRNRAVGSTYEMTLSVFDDAKPSHTVTATIIVEVTPVNDFQPAFDKKNYTFAVPETAGENHNVGKVTATDKDYPSNCLTYRIVRGDVNPAEIFWLDPVSGMIKLIRQPDYESIPQYKLTIEAVDCDPVNPKSASTMVIVNIKEENDEAPDCTPYTYRATVLDNIPTGTNINSFRLSCQDRDSIDSAMRFEIVSGNRANHFGLDPTRGSNSPKLIVKNPFALEGEMDFQPQYHLVVHITDDNLYNNTVSKPRTGTVLIDISVIRTNTPPPTTTPFDKKKGLTIVYTSVNTYSSADWYIPFIFTLAAILSIGLITCWCYLLWRYVRCKNLCLKWKAQDPRTIKGINTYRPGTQKERLEVIKEITDYETVFDGEAQDPVTGNLYQYNSKSGARKWKVPQEPMRGNMELTNIYALSQKLSPENSMSMNSPKET